MNKLKTEKITIMNGKYCINYISIKADMLWIARLRGHRLGVSSSRYHCSGHWTPDELMVDVSADPPEVLSERVAIFEISSFFDERPSFHQSFPKNAKSTKIVILIRILAIDIANNS